jgi:hypothetical protein
VLTMNVMNLAARACSRARPAVAQMARPDRCAGLECSLWHAPEGSGPCQMSPSITSTSHDAIRSRVLPPVLLWTGVQDHDRGPGHNLRFLAVFTFRNSWVCRLSRGVPARGIAVRRQPSARCVHSLAFRNGQHGSPLLAQSWPLALPAQRRLLKRSVSACAAMLDHPAVIAAREQKACWFCGEEAPAARGSFVCSNCGHLQPPQAGFSYFELFGLCAASLLCCTSRVAQACLPRCRSFWMCACCTHLLIRPSCIFLRLPSIGMTMVALMQARAVRNQ